MADEKTAPQPTTESHTGSDAAAVETAGVAATPTGWIYKRVPIGPFKLPYYASPRGQLLVVSFTCFLCPGMFNALTSLGGAGVGDPKAADNANIALYSTFSVVGFFGGTISNVIGLRWALSFGGFGYFIYAASILCWKHTENYGFPIFAGALLGVCAGLLWTAQGAVMTSYPPEHRKGRYIAVFWLIFNLGSVVGSLIPLGQNIHNGSSTATDGTFAAFMILMFLGAVFACFLLDPKKIIREDGSHVILMKRPTWKTELLGMWECLHTDLYIVALWPMFFASNWFYTYQFNAVNLANFNIRTRSLNSVLYWLAQVFGALIFGYALDFPGIRRSLKARIAIIWLFVFTLAVWGGGYDYQKGYTRATRPETGGPMDWTDSGYVGPMFLYIFYGLFDAGWQTTVYWLMGAMTNSTRKSAFFVGFYKGIQSAGSVIMWRVDELATPYMSMFASCWALLLGGLVCAAPIVWWKIKDHVEIEEDLKFSDETIADVLAPGLAAPDFPVEVPPVEHKPAEGEVKA